MAEKAVALLLSLSATSFQLPCLELASLLTPGFHIQRFRVLRWQLQRICETAGLWQS